MEILDGSTMVCVRQPKLPNTIVPTANFSFSLAVTLEGMFSIPRYATSAPLKQINLLSHLSANHRNSDRKLFHQIPQIRIDADVNRLCQELAILQSGKLLFDDLEVGRTYNSFELFGVNKNFRFRCHFHSLMIERTLSRVKFW